MHLTVVGIENLPLMSWAIGLLLANRSLRQKEILIQSSELPFLGRRGGKKTSHTLQFRDGSLIPGVGGVSYLTPAAAEGCFCVAIDYVCSPRFLEIGGLGGG